MQTFTNKDAETLTLGRKMLKRPNPVFIVKQDAEFTVETDSGVLQGVAGDSVAYDPISGHVWPIKQSYLDQHYDDFDGTAVSETENDSAYQRYKEQAGNSPVGYPAPTAVEMQEGLTDMSDDQFAVVLEAVTAERSARSSTSTKDSHEHTWAMGIVNGGQQCRTCSYPGCGKLELL